MSLPRELRDLIESGPMAHLSTVNADGSPQVSVIWIGLAFPAVRARLPHRYRECRTPYAIRHDGQPDRSAEPVRCATALLAVQLG
jgi:hypothetical protein